VAVAASANADDPWVSTRSAHFSVVSNAGPKTAESVALQFERVRAMFKKQWPWARVDAAEPTVIFAVKDEKTMRSLLPAFWQRKDGARPGGLSLVSPDRITLVVRTDMADDENPFAILYHEYTHRLLALNFPWLPLWLNEGLAEFYASSVIDGDDLTQGRPRPETIMLLRSSKLLPLETLFEVDQTSPHYNEQTRATIFYAQSWALVHYLILGDKQAHTAQLNELVSQLRRGVPDSEARAALGDLKALDRALASYVRNFVFTYRKAKDYLGETGSDMRSRPLSAAEAAAARGDFLARTGQIVEARALLDEATKLDPSLPESYETLAALSLGLQKPDEARAHAKKAIVLTTTNYFTWFLAGVLAATDGKLSEDTEKALRRSLELNPDHAAAVFTLATLLADSEEHRSESARLAARIPDLAPTNFVLQLTAAETLVKTDHTEEARAIAVRVEALAPAGPLKEAAKKLLARALPKDPAKRLAFHLKGCGEGKAADCTEAGSLYALDKGVARDYPRAVELYRRACDAGHAMGCAWLGSQYDSGQGVAKDEARAATLYQRACEGGFAWACAHLGLLYFEGRGVAKDVAKAEPYLLKGCDGGEEWICSKLAWLLLGGRGLPEDPSRAAKLYQKGCDAKEYGGCSGLAWMYAEGKGLTKDDVRATELYRKSCELGGASACATAGYRYQKALGVGADESAAASLYQRGCDGNDAYSCVNLGFQYASGAGVSKDPARGAELFVKACDLGDGLACEYAGQAYEAGTGVGCDMPRATSYFDKACAAKTNRTCVGLAKVLLEHTHPDSSHAIQVLKDGCDAGSGESCSLLAVCHGTGTGVPRDPAKAMELSKKACELGFKGACPSSVTPEMAKQAVAGAGQECDGGKPAFCGYAGAALLEAGDFTAAAGFFGRGCEAGDPASCAQLATAHLLGRGAPRDSARARQLYKKACQAGDASACDALKLTR